MTDALYTAKAEILNGRDGHAVSSDGRLDVALSHPLNPQRPATGTDPEQLFAAGYGACFSSAVAFVAKQQGVALGGQIAAKATVRLLKREAGGFIVGVDLDITVPGVDDATAQQLVTAAHQVCPYSNATRGNIEVNLTAHGA